MKTLTSCASITLITLFALLIAGCGGGGNSLTPGVGGGSHSVSAAFTIKWPERTRLIPLACESIKVEARNTGGFTTAKVVNRPEEGGTATVTLDQLPVGEITFTATAHPQTGAQGIAQAIGSVTQTGQANQHLQITLTMGSTIESVELTPANPTVGVNGTRHLTATAKNAAGEVVLVPTTSAFTWISSNPAKATVDGNGLVTGIAEGTATITATEQESGKSGTTTVSVQIAAQWQEKIIFSSYTTGTTYDLYLINPDGSGLQQITNTPDLSEIHPCISPTGTKIAYTLYDPIDHEVPGVYTMNIDGSGNKCIAETGSGLRWSPDESKIAIGYEDIGGISIVNADGSGLPVHIPDAYQPSWSPDGRKIVFGSNMQAENYNLSVINADGTGRTVITSLSGGDVCGTSWSPDGSTIAFGYGGSIYTVSPDGSNLQQLVSGASQGPPPPGGPAVVSYSDPCWSPDGSRIIYEATTNSIRIPWIMNGDGSNQHQVWTGTESFHGNYWGRINIGPTWTGDITVR